MRKTILLLSAFLMLACSGSDDSSTTNQKINPPTWIQGMWLNEEFEGTGYTSGFKFASHDFCTVLLSNTTCYEEQPLQIAETTTNTTYEITLSGGGSTVTYNFVKVDSTQIKSADVTYTKQ